MDTVARVGKLIEGPADRDAIHIAVMPVVCYEDSLQPGQAIGLEEGTNRAVLSHDQIGIVDPFLKQTVRWKQEFYLFLWPGSITSLVHKWTHPKVDNESVEYIKYIATKCGMRVESLMNAAELYVECGDYTHMGSNEDYKDVTSEEWGEFWKHYSIVTGKPASEDGYFFSCAC